MEILEFIKKNADSFASITNAADVVSSVVSKMQEMGYSALANNAKEPLYVSKEQFDQVSTQAGALNKQLEDLKKAAKGNAELTTTIEDLQKKNSEWEGKYKDGMLVNAVKMAAIKANARDASDVLSLIDKSKLVLKEDNSVDGLDDQLKCLKESKAYLFGETVKIDGANPNNETKTVTEKAASDFAAGLNG